MTAAYASDGNQDDDVVKSGTNLGKDKNRTLSRLTSQDANRRDSSVKRITPLFNANDSAKMASQRADSEGPIEIRNLNH